MARDPHRVRFQSRIRSAFRIPSASATGGWSLLSCLTTRSRATRHATGRQRSIGQRPNPWPVPTGSSLLCHKRGCWMACVACHSAYRRLWESPSMHVWGAPGSVPEVAAVIVCRAVGCRRLDGRWAAVWHGQAGLSWSSACGMATAYKPTTKPLRRDACDGGVGSAFVSGGLRLRLSPEPTLTIHPAMPAMPSPLSRERHCPATRNHAHANRAAPTPTERHATPTERHGVAHAQCQ